MADQERRYGFDELRSIAIGAAERARDLQNRTPEQCADLVLADLGIERNPGPVVRMEFESQIVFCRVCGRPPQQHPFGNCADLRIGGEPR